MSDYPTCRPYGPGGRRLGFYEEETWLCRSMRLASRYNRACQSQYGLPATAYNQAKTMVCRLAGRKGLNGTARVIARRTLRPVVHRRLVRRVPGARFGCRFSTRRLRGVSIYKETASGMRLDRAEWQKTLRLARLSHNRGLPQPRP